METTIMGLQFASGFLGFSKAEVSGFRVLWV